MAEEEKIVIEAKNGDKKSFANLVIKYQKYAFNLAFRLTCNEEDAKDVVQESFLKIWRNFSSFDTKQEFSTWMYKVVTNTAIDHNRKRKPSIVDLDTINTKALQIYENPESSLSNKELSNLLDLATSGLSELQKAVYVLRDIQGLESVEVCQILEQSPNNIKSNLYHARKSVRKFMMQMINFEKNER